MVVTYRSADDIGPCVDSLRAAGVERVVVVDNASGDGTAEVARATGAQVLALDENLGFGGGVNRGAAELDEPYLVVSNPDAVADPDAVDHLVDLLEARPEVGLAGPRIVNPDGSLYPNVRRFPDLATAVGHAVLGLVWRGNPFTRRYTMAGWDHSDVADVDWVAGTFFAIRRTDFDRLGGFDRRYFMYMEDVDLCWRLHKAGRVVAYEPAARVVHAIGRSTSQRPYRMIVEHHRSIWQFAAATTTGWHRALLPGLAAALVGRTVAAWLHHVVRRRPHAAP